MTAQERRLMRALGDRTLSLRDCSIAVYESPVRRRDVAQTAEQLRARGWVVFDGETVTATLAGRFELAGRRPVPSGGR